MAAVRCHSHCFSTIAADCRFTSGCPPVSIGQPLPRRNKLSFGKRGAVVRKRVVLHGLRVQSIAGFGRGSVKIKEEETSSQDEADSGRGAKKLLKLPGTVKLPGTGRPRLKDNNVVFVAGATGKVGSRTVRELLKLGFRVRASTRVVDKAEALFEDVVQKSPAGEESKASNPLANFSPANFFGFLNPKQGKSLEIVECDLENPETIEPALGNAGVVVCCIGASEKEILDVSGPYRIDYKATRNLIDAASAAEVSHFVLLTSLGTRKFGLPAAALNLFWGVLIWKAKAERALFESGLPYTIVRPGGMERPTDAYKETHNLVLAEADTLFGGQVSNLQVAELIASIVGDPDISKNKIIEVVAETTAPLQPIDKLVEEISVQKGKSPNIEGQGTRKVLPQKVDVAAQRPSKKQEEERIAEEKRKKSQKEEEMRKLAAQRLSKKQEEERIAEEKREKAQKEEEMRRLDALRKKYEKEISSAKKKEEEAKIAAKAALAEKAELVRKAAQIRAQAEAAALAARQAKALEVAVLSAAQGAKVLSDQEKKKILESVKSETQGITKGLEEREKLKSKSYDKRKEEEEYKQTELKAKARADQAAARFTEEKQLKEKRKTALFEANERRKKEEEKKQAESIAKAKAEQEAAKIAEREQAEAMAKAKADQEAAKLVEKKQAESIAKAKADQEAVELDDKKRKEAKEKALKEEKELAAQVAKRIAEAREKGEQEKKEKEAKILAEKEAKRAREKEDADRKAKLLKEEEAAKSAGAKKKANISAEIEQQEMEKAEQEENTAISAKTDQAETSVGDKASDPVPASAPLIDFRWPWQSARKTDKTDISTELAEQKQQDENLRAAIPEATEQRNEEEEKKQAESIAKTKVQQKAEKLADREEEESIPKVKASQEAVELEDKERMEAKEKALKEEKELAAQVAKRIAEAREKEEQEKKEKEAKILAEKKAKRAREKEDADRKAKLLKEEEAAKAAEARKTADMTAENEEEEKERAEKEENKAIDAKREKEVSSAPWVNFRWLWQPAKQMDQTNISLESESEVPPSATPLSPYTRNQSPTPPSVSSPEVVEKSESTVTSKAKSQSSGDEKTERSEAILLEDVEAKKDKDGVDEKVSKEEEAQKLVSEIAARESEALEKAKAATEEEAQKLVSEIAARESEALEKAKAATALFWPWQKPETASAPTEEPKKEGVQDLPASSRPLSPYAMFPDLKPPSFPTPSPPQDFRDNTILKNDALSEGLTEQSAGFVETLVSEVVATEKEALEKAKSAATFLWPWKKPTSKPQPDEPFKGEIKEENLPACQRPLSPFYQYPDLKPPRPPRPYPAGPSDETSDNGALTEEPTGYQEKA